MSFFFFFNIVKDIQLRVIIGRLNYKLLTITLKNEFFLHILQLLFFNLIIPNL